MNNPKIIQLKKFLDKRKNKITFKEVRFLFELIDEKEEVVEKARKIFRTWYMRQYKKKRRRTHPECVVFFSEFEDFTISETAEKHQMNKPEFVRKAAIAYINQKYLLPNEQLISSVESLLSILASEFSFYADQYPGAIGTYLSKLEERFYEIEGKFSQLLREPKKVEAPIYSSVPIRQEILF